MNDWIHQPVSVESCERVRAGVARRVGCRKRVRRAAATATAGLLCLLFVWPRASEIETLALQMPPAPPAQDVLLMPRPRVPVPLLDRRPSMATVVASREAGKIVLFTEDPEVVIVLVNSEGGAE